MKKIILAVFLFLPMFLAGCSCGKDNIVYVNNIVLSSASIVVGVDENVGLNNIVTVTPSNSNISYTAESLNTEIAVVNNNKIIGVTAGSTKILIKAKKNKDEFIEKQIDVEVVKRAQVSLNFEHANMIINKNETLQNTLTYIKNGTSESLNDVEIIIPDSGVLSYNKLTGNVTANDFTTDLIVITAKIFDGIDYVIKTCNVTITNYKYFNPNDTISINSYNIPTNATCRIYALDFLFQANYTFAPIFEVEKNDVLAITPTGEITTSSKSGEVNVNVIIKVGTPESAYIVKTILVKVIKQIEINKIILLNSNFEEVEFATVGYDYCLKIEITGEIDANKFVKPETSEYVQIQSVSYSLGYAYVNFTALKNCNNLKLDIVYSDNSYYSYTNLVVSKQFNLTIYEAVSDIGINYFYNNNVVTNQVYLIDEDYIEDANTDGVVLNLVLDVFSLNANTSESFNIINLAEDVVSINYETKMVTPIKEGSAEILVVSMDDFAFSKTFTIVVCNVYVTEIECSDIYLVLNGDQNETMLNYQIKPLYAFNKEVQFEFAEGFDSYISFNDGTIIGIACGATTLTFIINEQILLTINIKVVEPITSFTLNYEDVEINNEDSVTINNANVVLTCNVFPSAVLDEAKLMKFVYLNNGAEFETSEFIVNESGNFTTYLTLELKKSGTQFIKIFNVLNENVFIIFELIIVF